jgi:hypothetical protein
MSFRRPGQTECVKDGLHLARLSRRCPDREQGGETRSAASISAHSFVFRAANFTIICALAFVCWGSEISRAQQSDFGAYARAVEYCRGNVERPMALDLHKRVLCFDGEISPGLDISSSKGLEENGLFVVRSFGNDIATAIALADLLRERRATVVVYDYCLFACASYLTIASTRTFVLKDALVAWRHFDARPNDCAGFAKAKDEGPLRLEVGLCPNPPLEFRSESGELERLKEQFYRERFVDPLLEFPPESFTVRKSLKNLVADGTGAYPNVMWTWNPRYYASAIKTKIAYEAYPKSQDETNAIATRLRLLYRVIYDP